MSIDIPLVSSITNTMNNAPIKHPIAYISIHPCNPMISAKMGNSFALKNSKMCNTTEHKATPIERIYWKTSQVSYKSTI